MKKKLYFLIAVIGIGLPLLGVSSIYKKYNYYQRAYKTRAVIEKFEQTEMCRISYRHCKYGQQLKVSFIDKDNKKAQAFIEVSTITLLSGVISEGDKVDILYSLNTSSGDILEKWFPIKNLGPALYENVVLYTWHYWFYPIVLIFLGPFLYLIGWRALRNTFPNKPVL